MDPCRLLRSYRKIEKGVLVCRGNTGRVIENKLSYRGTVIFICRIHVGIYRARITLGLFGASFFGTSLRNIVLGGSGLGGFGRRCLFIGRCRISLFRL